MREIVSKPLDREAFRPYGDFVDLLHIKQMMLWPERIISSSRI